MSTPREPLFGLSTIPVKEESGALLVHIKASLQALVDRSR
jgi:hypothetical protein